MAKSADSFLSYIFRLQLILFFTERGDFIHKCVVQFEDVGEIAFTVSVALDGTGFAATERIDLCHGKCLIIFLILQTVLCWVWFAAATERSELTRRLVDSGRANFAGASAVGGRFRGAPETIG